jgi:ADP-ribosylglycohydrolase
MLGAIIGDIIGSTYEFHNAGKYDFDPFPSESDFTDDTVLTIAVADAILNNKPYGTVIKEYAINWPNRGYGLMFRSWYRTDNPQPYNCFGNGSAMRVSSIGWAFDTLERTIQEAGKSAECTHTLRAELLYSKNDKYEVKSAGVTKGAKVKVTSELLHWADMIFVFGRRAAEISA